MHTRILCMLNNIIILRRRVILKFILYQEAEEGEIDILLIQITL